jgi:hypothetical protein
MFNVLHYSFRNENESLIKYFISMDKEMVLRKEKNIQGKQPLDDKKGNKFSRFYYSIWEATLQNKKEVVKEFLSENPQSID